MKNYLLFTFMAVLCMLLSCTSEPEQKETQETPPIEASEETTPEELPEPLPNDPVSPSTTPKGNGTSPSTSGHSSSSSSNSSASSSNATNTTQPSSSAHVNPSTAPQQPTATPSPVPSTTPANPTSSSTPTSNTSTAPMLSQRDLEELEEQFTLSPKVVYLGEKVRFKVKPQPLYGKWNWEWDLNGDGLWDESSERNDSYIYKQLGETQISLQASEGSLSTVFSQNIVVTINPEKIKTLFLEIKTRAKQADQTESDQDIKEFENKINEVKKYLSKQALITLPYETERFTFEEFISTLRATIAIEEVYETIAEQPKYDQKSGLITFINFK